MAKMPSALLLTGNCIRHRYLAQTIAKDVNLKGVIFEAKKNQKRTESAETINAHFDDREVAERCYFPGAIEPSQLNIESIDIPNGTANSDEVYQWIMQRDPEYLMLFGSSIIKEHLLDHFKSRCINMHLGLSPYYRGSGTNMWPLVKNQPECVGVTIHVAELDVDAGPILKQVRPDIETQDTLHDIGCKTIRAGAKIFGATVAAHSAKKIKGVVQDLSIGEVYRVKDFSDAALVKISKNFDQGMIADFLANRSKRLQNYPIVE